MISTFRTKDDFLEAISRKLEEQGSSVEVRSALLSGISSADAALREKEGDQDFQAFNLKVGSWVVRDDDLPIFQAINATAAAVALTLTTGGLAAASLAAALTSFADLCWRMWRKGGRLSRRQVSAYGFLQALGPMTVQELLAHLKGDDKKISSEDLTSILRSLAEIELNDGHIVALTAENSNGQWKALKI
ncbi:MAG: hypothetical protein JOY71_19190 [Acetobacteraceae bacterium]|nr:hypothetical protein [Acetobacteraceae bacterium]